MDHKPLVTCLTNAVAAPFTANCLLAIGAKPAMVGEPSEAEELTAVADALLINVGTVTAHQAEAMKAAVRVANRRGIPWVLDPVGVQFLAFRQAVVLDLLSLKPTLIRGNHDEIDFILGTVPTLKGSVPLLSTGEVDRIIIEPEVVENTGGVPLLQTVTATGCAQGGLCAAFLGRGLPPRNAAIRASKLMKAAGERAASRTHAPGSFQAALIDALWEIEHD